MPWSVEHSRHWGTGLGRRIRKMSSSEWSSFSLTERSVRQYERDRPRTALKSHIHGVVLDSPCTTS